MKGPHRKNIRLRGYDYSEMGWYFVTLCVQGRKCLFGNIVIDELINGVGVDPCVDPKPIMQLNDIGKIVNKWLLKIPDKFPVISLDVFQIMPNHIHIIIINNGRTHGSAPTLGTIIQWFKSMVTNDYINNIKTNNWPNFNKRLFQRNYYEHIIRNDKELYEIREYISLNPSMWDKDKDNPKNIKK